MKIGVVLRAAEVDGGTPGWATVRAYATHAEAAGFDSVWMFDHFFHRRAGGPPEAMHEAWTIVSAVAAVTERVEIGQLVMCTGFRSPGLLAKMAVTVDAVSGGRLILGLGAGWYDEEFEAFGFPTDHKIGQFEEALQIIAGLLHGEQVTFDGRWHRTRDAVLAPAPSRRIPILVAADAPRMRRLTARYADAWATAWYGWPDDLLDRARADMETSLLDFERDGATLQRFAGIVVVDPTATLPEDDEPSIMGHPAEVLGAVEAYRSLGFDHLIVQLQPMTESWLDRFAEIVLPGHGRSNVG